MNSQKRITFPLIAIAFLLAQSPGANAQNQKHIVRMARIEIDSQQLDAYKAFLQEEIETSTRIEPGVLSLNAVYDTKNPTHITILETYADTASYQAHLKRPHFLKYKAAVKDMVKKLELIEVSPVVPSIENKTKNDSIHQNIAADNIFLQVFETGEIGKLDDIITPDFYNHTGNHKGLDALKTAITDFHNRMKTVKLALIRQMADNEYVSDWVRYTGADPAQIIEGMELTKYKNGKAIEHWFFPTMANR